MKRHLVLGLAIAVVALVALPTTAQEGQLTYASEGVGRGLRLSLGGNALELGVIETIVQSGPTEECQSTACATAAGLREPSGGSPVATAIWPDQPGPVTVQTFGLGQDVDPGFEQALVLNIGDATAQATSATTSAGQANAAQVDITLTQSILSQLPPELTGPLQEGLEQLGEGLEPITSQDPTGVLAGVVDQIVDLGSDLTSAPIATLNQGPTRGSNTFANGTVASHVEAGGLVLVLVPTPESSPLTPEGLIVIEAGSSSATASADGVNPAVGEFEPGSARITLLPGILDALPDIIIPPEGGDGGTPLDDIIEQLPPEVVELLPGGGGDEPTEEPTAEPTDGEGPTGTPIDEVIPTSRDPRQPQPDPNTGGLVIEVSSGEPETCVAEGTPLETCVIVGGGQTVSTEDGLGIVAVASGISISAFRAEGQGQLEFDVARSQAGVNAQIVTPPTTPTTPPTQTTTPVTGPSVNLVIPALVLLALSGVSLVALRRERR